MNLLQSIQESRTGQAYYCSIKIEDIPRAVLYAGERFD